MHSRHFALVATLLALTSCAAANRPLAPWKIELTTSGGIAGKGTGSYTIDSDGAITVTTMTGTQCTYKATDQELRTLTELLTDARPTTWKSSYSPENICCDRITYSLRVTAAGATKPVSWIDDPLPMPHDLSALADAVRAQLHASAERCRVQ